MTLLLKQQETKDKLIVEYQQKKAEIQVRDNTIHQRERNILTLKKKT